MTIHHACRSDCDQPDVFRTFSGAQDLTIARLAIGLTVPRCDRIKLAACARRITVADMLCGLLGHAFPHDRGGPA